MAARMEVPVTSYPEGIDPDRWLRLAGAAHRAGLSRTRFRFLAHLDRPAGGGVTTLSVPSGRPPVVRGPVRAPAYPSAVGGPLATFLGAVTAFPDVVSALFLGGGIVQVEWAPDQGEHTP